MNMNLICDKLDNNFCLWAAECDENSSASLLLEGCLKIKRGVKYLLEWSNEFNPAGFKKEVLSTGVFSQRPYSLSQEPDDSTGICVFALYYDYCIANYLDPKEVLYRVYKQPYYLSYDFPGNRKIAEWQGVVYPKEWNKQNKNMLIDCLKKQGFDALADELVFDSN